jgi:hypothetical protein
MIAHFYSDKRGGCYPKQETLAERVGVSRRQVRTLAKRLIQGGDIFVKVSGRGRGRSTVYGLAPKYLQENGKFGLPILPPENGKSEAVKWEVPSCESGPQWDESSNVVVGEKKTPPAQTPTNFEDLIETLQKEYPQHNVSRESNNAEKYYGRQGKALTRSRLIGWMKRAEPPLKRAKSIKQSPKPQPAGWLEWVKETYPDAHIKDYWKVTDSVKEEFKEANSNAAR